jgi:hypothetical protein
MTTNCQEDKRKEILLFDASSHHKVAAFGLIFGQESLEVDVKLRKITAQNEARNKKPSCPHPSELSAQQMLRTSLTGR